jgi:geranyl-CoA carboxylase alpha subunit
LRVARGEDLPIAQHDVRIAGHAIEVRLCAEDPADAFLPRSGMVLDWRPEPLARCDHAVAAGLAISPYYDSMLAKLIVHGTSRAEALDRLALALDRTVLLGVESNRAFLARVLRHPSFADGAAVSTAFIERHFPQDADRATVPDDVAWSLAAWLSVAAAPESAAAAATPWRQWTNGLALPAPWRLAWQSSEREGRVALSRDSARVECSGTAKTVVGAPARPASDGQVEIDGAAVAYRYAWHGSTLWLHLRDGDFAFECQRRLPRRATTDRAAQTHEVRSAINGRVLEVCVATGSDVIAGQRLLVLEAMKMEHALPAPRAGRVASIGVEPGQQVSPGQLLLSYERGA